MKSVYTQSTIILLALIAGVYGWLYFFGAHRPYINWSPVELAKYIVEHNRSAEECWDLVVLDPFGPQAAIRRAGCVYKVAERTMDPAVCELLMPSSYGLSCVGGANPAPRPCTIAFGRIVEWGSYANNTHEKATLAECVTNKFDTELGQLCCEIAKIANLIGYDDCSSLIDNVDMHNLCLAELALKTGQEEICDPITLNSGRIACKLRAKYKSVLRDLPQPITLEEVDSDDQ